MSSSSEESYAADALALERHIQANDPLAVTLRAALYGAARTRQRLTVDDLRQTLQQFVPVNGKTTMTVCQTVTEDYEIYWQNEEKQLYFIVTKKELAAEFDWVKSLTKPAKMPEPSPLNAHFRREYMDRYWRKESRDK